MGEKGTLILLEFLVNDVILDEELMNSRPEYKIGKLVVFVKFLHFQPLIIEEDTRYGHSSKKGTVQFQNGKSCLFSVPDYPVPDFFVVDVFVLRKRPDGVVPDQITLGFTKINFTQHFINIMKEYFLYPHELPVCKALKDDYVLTDVTETTVIGLINLNIRATCLGKIVVTQLRKNGQNSFLIKGNRNDALYQCESIISRLPAGDCYMGQDEKDESEGELFEKSFAEEFSNILGKKPDIVEFNADKCETNFPCDTGDVPLESYYDERNRPCVVYRPRLPKVSIPCCGCCPADKGGVPCPKGNPNRGDGPELTAAGTPLQLCAHIQPTGVPLTEVYAMQGTYPPGAAETLQGLQFPFAQGINLPQASPAGCMVPKGAALPVGYVPPRAAALPVGYVPPKGLAPPPGCVPPQGVVLPQFLPSQHVRASTLEDLPPEIRGIIEEMRPVFPDAVRMEGRYAKGPAPAQVPSCGGGTAQGVVGDAFEGRVLPQEITPSQSPALQIPTPLVFVPPTATLPQEMQPLQAGAILQQYQPEPTNVDQQANQLQPVDVGQQPNQPQLCDVGQPPNQLQPVNGPQQLNQFQLANVGLQPNQLQPVNLGQQLNQLQPFNVGPPPNQLQSVSAVQQPNQLQPVNVGKQPKQPQSQKTLQEPNQQQSEDPWRQPCPPQKGCAPKAFGVATAAAALRPPTALPAAMPSPSPPLLQQQAAPPPDPENAAAQLDPLVEARSIALLKEPVITVCPMHTTDWAKRNGGANPPILKSGAARDAGAKCRGVAFTGATGPRGPSGGATGTRVCKQCTSAGEPPLRAPCPAYPEDAVDPRPPTFAELHGIAACEAECLPFTPPAPPLRKEDKEARALEPRFDAHTASAGRAVVMSRMLAARRSGAPKAPKPKTQPVRVLAAKRKWEADPAADAAAAAAAGPLEDPAATARFPPKQPYSSDTDIEIRTPADRSSDVFEMKMMDKSDQKPVLQLELRTPRKVTPEEAAEEARKREEEEKAKASEKKGGGKGKKKGKGKGKGKKGKGKGKKGKKK